MISENTRLQTEVTEYMTTVDVMRERWPLRANCTFCVNAHYWLLSLVIMIVSLWFQNSSDLSFHCVQINQRSCDSQKFLKVNE